MQRELLDPAAYVELWLKDAGLHGAHDYLDRYDAWLSWFDEQGVEAIGFGWVNLRRRGDARPGMHRFLDWPHAVEQPVAPGDRRLGRGPRRRGRPRQACWYAARTCSRRPSASPGPRTRPPWSCASSAA